MPDIPAEAGAQFGVFSAPQAVRSGWTRGSLDYAVRNGRLLRPKRGLYVCAEETVGSGAAADRRRLVVASALAVMAQPGSIASHRSAAAIAGTPLLTTPSIPCVTVAPGRHSRGLNAHVHRARLDGRQILTSGSILRTSLARTIVDVARESGVDEAVVIADAALHSGLTDIDSLAQQIETCRHWPGVRRAVAVLERCDRLAESPLESISRLRLAETILPVPELQPDILDHRGKWVARCDFFWREAGVIGEADGLDKYDTSPDALRNEKIRQEALERTGLLVVRWGWRDLLRMDLLTERIQWALSRGSARAAEDRRWLVGTN